MNRPITHRCRRPSRSARGVRALFGALLALLITVTVAVAHPLGNFTVNRYSRIELAQAGTRLVYVVDMAEIPTHRQRTRMDGDSDGTISQAEQDAYLQSESAALTANLQLRIAEQSVNLTIENSELTFAEGQAGLPTMRLKIIYNAATEQSATEQTLRYQDSNFAGQLGWQEVVVTPLDGVRILNATVPAIDLSDELRKYPESLLTNPPAITQAEATFTFAAVANNGNPATQSATSPASSSTAIGKPTDGFADLIKLEELTLGGILLALLAAFGWGAAHALSPGHGKTIVAAYLVGSRGTVGHALFLGLTTTITHTAGVFALGFVTLFASRYILPETLYPWLSAISGLLVVWMGVTLAWGRLRSLRGKKAQHDPAHDHAQAGYHDHGDGNYHSHVPPGVEGPVRWGSLLALGVSGGLIPCPSALVLMLGAISLQRVGLGMLLIFVFSLGLASVLSAIGIALVRARRLFDYVPETGGAMRLLPVASALFIAIVGMGITWQAVMSAWVS